MGKRLIKSKERVQKHGEVFTPQWMVEKMLAEPGIQAKLQDIHATFLEPSAGEGAFLTEILRQKLNYVNEVCPPVVRQREKLWLWKRNTLWALMSIYGIEYLMDNLQKARQNMMEVFCENYHRMRKRELGMRSELYRSARLIVDLNIVLGNTLTREERRGKPIIFNEWRPDETDARKVQRVPFRYGALFPDAEELPDEQIALFDTVQTFNLFTETQEEPTLAYRIVDVLKVYKQEMRAIEQGDGKDGREV